MDTNALVYYLHRVEPYASKTKKILVEKEDLAITLRIVDEAIFTFIRLDALRKLEIKRLDQLRDYIRKHGIERFADAINDVEELIEGLGILVLEDKGNLKELLETMKNYNLLPGDALIAITARLYDIDTILTFDQDFKRVPWLEVIP
ncbi:MAG: PIN domain-containing protein [Desulfurococcales archaeon]|nr:PIN domain-containing protein [Desulfurococcales archaeon]